MSYLVKDGNLADKYFKASGAGTLADPHMAQHQVSFTDGPTVDAFGRLRVGSPTTLFDSKQLYDKQPLFWDEAVSGATETSVHSTTEASTVMTVNAASDYVIRQTKMRFNYQPGKSQEVLCSFTLGTGVANVVKRVGYFNSSTVAPYNTSYDGIYLEQDGGTQSIVQSKSGTASSIAQASWNIDPMDGTGPSGVTIDWSKSQILFIDFEWLGVGRVRVGFVVDGNIYYAHEFLNANGITSVYMTSPNHSVRYEIRSTGGVGSLRHICSSVASEAGSEALGRVQSVNTAGTHLDASTENTTYALIGIRLKSTHFDSVLRILDEAVQIQTTSHQAIWSLYYNPTVAGTFTYSPITNSSVEVATGVTANTVSGGTLLASGFVESAGSKDGGAGSFVGSIDNALRLGASIDGTPDEFVLAVTPIAGSSNVEVEGSLTWRELV